MNKNIKAILIIFAVMIPAVIVAVALTSSKSEAPTVDHSKHSSEEHAQYTNNSSNSSEAQKTSTENDQSGIVKVDIKNYAYAPATITVKAGTTVVWTNQDSVQHDVVAANPSASAPKSDLLVKGESYSFTFNKPGTYDYYCSPHTYMKGKVVVTE